MASQLGATFGRALGLGLLCFLSACDSTTDAARGLEHQDAQSHARSGQSLFEDETFGGNGRTCSTCHSAGNGTVTLEQIAARFAADPQDPLFVGDGSDDGQGHGSSRILRDGTILVTLPLPANVTLLDAPLARSVTFRRGIPSTMNTPALDPVLMYDGRAADLVEQARGAILGHTGTTVEPAQEDLERIAEFEQTASFFTSAALRDFAAGGPPPMLPEGNTPAEQRGRRFFDDVPLVAGSKAGICAHCHSGPMLNETNGFGPLPVPPFRAPKGQHFSSILSSELMSNGDPLHTFAVNDGNRSTVQTISDPGRALITGDFRPFPDGHLGQFKNSSLWNVKNTAPYFHNNGAKTLRDVLDHYERFFIIATPVAAPGFPPILLTEEDKTDLLAFLNLL